MSQIRTWKYIVLFSIAILLGLFSSPQVFAQSLSCGNIQAPQNFFTPGPNNSLTTVAVGDCDDPFSLTTNPSSPYSLVIAGKGVEDGGIIALPEGRTKDVVVNGNSNLDGTDLLLFRHNSDNYVYQSLYAPKPTEAEIEAYAETFFPTNQEAQFYFNIVDDYVGTGDTDQFFYDEDGEDIIDPNTGETVEARFYNFYFSALDFYEIENKPYIEAGTYTVVMREFEIILSQRTIFDKIFDLFITTAYAQYNLQYNTYAITFTIIEEIPEPAGASSVLFLPGIQASRLYTDGLFGTEDQLWEPNANSDVETLAMTESGESINEVYTKEVIDEVNITPLIQTNIYKGFLNMLEDLVSDGVIADFEPFAYDWRYSVEDVVKNGTQYENEIRSIITKIEELAEDSYSGKVTVIGHSNGGLVAKALVSELERLGKANLIDKVVFIGTPHLGTPKAIGTVLHGYDQQKVGGAIIDDSTARAVIQNMPGAYSLLPSERYLQLANEPVITMTDSPSTQPMRSVFGETIEGVTEYKNFLNGTEGRVNNFDNISSPYKTNPALLQDALDLHEDLDSWEAPVGVEVFNLVGVGLPTIRAVEYRNVTERINCTGTFYGTIVCDEPVNFLRPYAYFSQYGDETVTSLSAQSVVGGTFYFDFIEYDENTVLLFDPSHADFTEIEQVQDFVSGIISSSTSLSSIPYISSTLGTFDNEYEVTSIDSPVRIVQEDAEGNKTGVVIQNGSPVIVKDIPGSDYFEFGGTKYLIVPKNISLSTTLYGEALGSYTLITANLKNGEEQTIETQLVNATTTPTMVATYERTIDGHTNVLTDYDGDGTTDIEMSLDGELVLVEKVTLAILRTQIIDLNLSKVRAAPLLLLIKLAEETAKLKVGPKIIKHLQVKLLIQLQDILKVYEKKRWITKVQKDSVVNLIQKLISL